MLPRLLLQHRLGCLSDKYALSSTVLATCGINTKSPTCSFMCALHPSLRNDWARTWNKVVKSGGYLIALEYPIRPDDKTGPPWPVSPQIYADLLMPLGKSLTQEVNGKAANGNSYCHHKGADSSRSLFSACCYSHFLDD